MRSFRWGIIMQSSPRIHSCKLQIKFQITYNRFVWPYTGLKWHREQFTVTNPVGESFERRSGGKAAILTTLTKLFSGIGEIKTVHSFWMAEEPGYKWVFYLLPSYISSFIETGYISQRRILSRWSFNWLHTAAATAHFFFSDETNILRYIYYYIYHSKAQCSFTIKQNCFLVCVSRIFCFLEIQMGRTLLRSKIKV